MICHPGPLAAAQRADRASEESAFCSWRENSRFLTAAQFGMTNRESSSEQMAYTVSKLTDYSAPALDASAAELLSALDDEIRVLLFADGKQSLEHRVEWTQRWEDWKRFRDRWMARKSGILTQINDMWLKGAPKEAKREAGQRVNKLKEQVSEKVDHSEQLLERQKVDAENAILDSAGTKSYATWKEALIATEGVDITLPVIRRPIGAE